LTFLKKIKKSDPLMGAKLKSKTHLLNIRFFIFFEPFFARLASKFSKSANVRNQFEILRFLVPILNF
jgi:hypothetical protein